MDRGPQGPHPRTPVLRGDALLGPRGKIRRPRSGGPPDRLPGHWALAGQNPWPLPRSDRAWPSEYRQPPEDGRGRASLSEAPSVSLRLTAPPEGAPKGGHMGPPAGGITHVGRDDPGAPSKPPPVGEVPSIARRKGWRGLPPPSGGGSLCPRRQRDQNAAGGGPRWTGAHRGLHPRTPVLRGTHYLGLGGKSGARDQVSHRVAFRATGPWLSKLYGSSFPPTAPGCPNTGSRQTTDGGWQVYRGPFSQPVADSSPRGGAKRRPRAAAPTKKRRQ